MTVLISFADTDMMDDLITQESKSEGCPNNSNVDVANMYFVQCVRSEKPSLSGVKHLHFCIYVVVSSYIKIYYFHQSANLVLLTLNQ